MTTPQVNQEAVEVSRSRSVLGLLAIGALLRVAYLLDYSGLPFTDGPLGDSVVYLHQAERVQVGEHGDSSLLAMSPGYGYFLALFGDERWLVILLQTAVGLLVGWGLAVLAGRLGGPRAMLSALGLYLGYGLIPFYESKLLSESLGLALAAAVVGLTLHRRYVHGSFGWAVAAGALLGIALLVRAHLVFIAPLLVLASMVRWDDEVRRARWIRTMGLVLGLGVVLLTRGAVAFAASGEFVMVLYTAPDAHVVGRSSGATYDGRLDAVGFGGTGPRSAWDVVRAVEEHRNTPAAARSNTGLWETARSIDLGAVVMNLPTRAAKTFRDYEATFQYAYYGEREVIPALRWLPITFPVMAWLALIGGFALARRRGLGALGPYMPWVFGILATCVLYMPTARYRLPMIVVLIPLAGFGVTVLVDAVRARRPIPRLIAAFTAALTIFTGWRTLTYEPQHPERWHLVLAESLAAQPHDPEVLEHHLRAALEVSRDERGRIDPDVEAHVRAIRRH